MTTHVLNGVTLVRDISQPGDPLVGVLPMTLSVVAPDGQTTFSYQVTSTNPGNLPLVDVMANETLLALNSLTPNSMAAGGANTETYIGQITWGGGNVTQIMTLESSDGTDTEIVSIFVLGGVPLPNLTTAAQFTAFEAGITGIGAIPGGTALSQGQNIAFASLPGITSQSHNPITGTTGNDTLTGTAGNDVINPLSNSSEDVIYGTAGNDILDFSNYEVGTRDFYTVSYSGLSAGITVNFDTLTGSTTVDKGVNGTDNLVDALVVMDWNYGDGMWVNATDHNDTFNLNLVTDTWLGLIGGAGVDTYNIQTESIVRVSFRDHYGQATATSGINVNLITGAVANDGHGNVEQINVLNAAARIEIEGTNHNDTITGSNRDERFILLQGNDTLDAGGGRDLLRYDRGGVGAVTVDLSAGTATGMWYGTAFTHQISNVEDLRGSRGSTDVLIGDNAANELRSYREDDTLLGGGGDDVLRAGLDDDLIDGGAGHDIARIDANSFEASITRTSNGVMVSSNDGWDVLTNVETLQFWDTSIDVGSLTIQSNVPSPGDDTVIGASGADTIDGQDGNDWLFGLSGNDSLMGGDGDDAVRGHEGNDTLYGGNGNDRIWGDAGDDYINPGENIEGYDEVRAGTGNDTIDMGQIVLGYVRVDQGDLDAGIVATLDGAANTGSIDKGANGTTMLLDVVNPLNYWGLGLRGTAYDDTFNVALDSTKYQWLSIGAGSGDNTINIGGGSDDGTLRLNYSGAGSAINANLATGIIQNGQGGTDTVTGSGPKIEIRGTDHTDTIIGSANDDRFILRQGNDTLDGGAGWDLLRYDRGGVDAVTVNLATGMATGLWYGQAFTHTFSNIEAVRGSRDDGDTLTGDAMANFFDGKGGDNTLTGGAGNDTLMSGSGADSLEGGAGDDELSAGTGNDMVSGGDGNDLIISTGGADTFDGGAGNDTLFSDASNDAPFSYVGAVDLLAGTSAAVGGANVDTLIGIENFRMIGQINVGVMGDTANNHFQTDAGIDTLNGWSGDDTLDGGAGGDLMIGGHGSDTFYVDDAGDRVAESRKWAGHDTVISSVDFRMGRRHIEDLELTGTATLGAGNGLMNRITGNDGNNTLDGGKNVDTLVGGLGNDLYIVRSPGDNIVEGYNEGIDAVRAYRSYALDGHVEKLYMQNVFTAGGAPANLNGIGNGLANTIIGTPYDNTIVGREGNDILKGQAGDDTFVFDRAIGAGNVDRIIDFEVIAGDNDTLKIKGALLGGAVATGVLDAADFAAGTAAGDASDRFVFDQASGQLWFDADGSGAGGQVLMATFEQNATVAADDILIF